MGQKEIEIVSTISREDWETGKCFLQQASSSAAPAATAMLAPALNKSFKAVRTADGSAPPATGSGASGTNRLWQTTPRYDPTAPGAIVMPQPPAHHQRLHNKDQLPVVDVVIDPHLAQYLRPHQRQGVEFLYTCVNGYSEASRNGAILADSMGLGKTLQCITLLWTLLKQGMYVGLSNKKMVSCLISMLGTAEFRP
jgi:DNA repair and recombination protein RAD54B